MQKGGNDNLYQFFEEYDLNYEPMQKRYSTLASEYYRSFVSLYLEFEQLHSLNSLLLGKALLI